MPGFELIGKEEQIAVQKVFEEGGVLFAHGFDDMRKKYHVREFESQSSGYFKSKHCLAVSSGTAGLKCALKAVGVGHGDEVITQAFNFIATVEAIIDTGAKPIICNIDDNLHMDIEDLEKRINKKTKAIIIVHMLGMGGPIFDVKKIGKKYNLPIIEDNCEAIGGKINNEYLGTLGDIGVMSFDHGKMIACGEGGMIFTNNKKYGEFISQYTDHGHENNPNLPRGRDRRIMPGFNYRLTEMQAAVGKVQLSKLDYMLLENKKRYEILHSNISKKAKIREEFIGQNGSYDTFIFSVEEDDLRVKIIDLLQDLEIGTKNLPDAMEWHCSYFWAHAISKDNVDASKVTYQILKKQIAIPIMLKTSLEVYDLIAKKICEIIK